jgi:hypothetical protein
VTVPLYNIGTPGFSTSTTAVGTYLLIGSQGARYARISVTYTSGTVAGTMTATTQGAATIGDYALGTSNDIACGGDASTGCTIEQRLQRIAQNITTLTQSITPNIVVTDGTNSALVDPCQSGIKTYTPINIVTATNTKIVAGVGGKKGYLCGLALYWGGTNNVAIVEGSGTNCGTSPIGIVGGATPATGIVGTASTTIKMDDTGYAHAATSVTGNDVCLITSAAVQLSGVAVTVTR